jgi:hypothetical protein
MFSACVSRGSRQISLRLQLMFICNQNFEADKRSRSTSALEY